MSRSSYHTGWEGGDAMFEKWKPNEWEDGFAIPEYAIGDVSRQEQQRLPTTSRRRQFRNSYPPFEHLIRLETLLKNAIIPLVSDLDTDSIPLRKLVPYFHSLLEKQQAGLRALLHDCCRTNDSAIRILFGARSTPAEEKIAQILKQLSMQSLDEPVYKRVIALRRFEDQCRNLIDHFATPLNASQTTPFRSFRINTVERFLQAMIAYTLFGWLRADLARLSELLLENWEKHMHHAVAGRYPDFTPRDIFKIKTQMVLIIRALPVLRHLQFITEYAPLSVTAYLQTKGRNLSEQNRRLLKVEFMLPDEIQEVISYVTLRSVARGAPPSPIPPFWPEHEKELLAFLQAAERPVHLATFDSKKPQHVDMKLSDNSSAQRFSESLSRVGKVHRDVQQKRAVIRHWAKHIPPEDDLLYTGDEDKDIKWEGPEKKRKSTWELKRAKGEDDEGYFAALPKMPKQMPQISSIMARVFKM